jgi:pSer/pThr/pTyr-binding forkhead associated (FHA) protein
MDCGKPLSASAVRSGAPYATGGSPIMAALAGAPSPLTGPSGTMRKATVVATKCPKCGQDVEAGLPYCGHCGTRIDAADAVAKCASCGAHYVTGIDLFCSRCGERVAGNPRPLDTPARPFGDLVLGAKPKPNGPRISVLNDEGEPTANYLLDQGNAVVGRGDADLRFDDFYLSPMHAQFELRNGELWIRDLGSRNGTWSFLDAPTRLSDGDIMLVGSQMIRFRRLGYPGPHPPERDSTRRMGSLVPSADIAVLEQLRADGSVRDTFHLSPARTIHLGRESGDWVFPYDPTMSGRHAEIQIEDSEFFVHDVGSRNGVALAVHGERIVKKGQRLLIGDQILRVESV